MDISVLKKTDNWTSDMWDRYKKETSWWCGYLWRSRWNWFLRQNNLCES